MDVSVDTTSAVSGGRKSQVFTPDTGNSIYKASMGSDYTIKRIHWKYENSMHADEFKHLSCCKLNYVNSKLMFDASFVFDIIEMRRDERRVV